MDGLSCLFRMARDLFHMSDNSIYYTPLDKIELTYGCCMTLEFYAIRSAKRIKKLFRVSVKATLILNMHRKPVNSHIILLCMFCDKPLYISQGQSQLVVENIMKNSLMAWFIKKSRQ